MKKWILQANLVSMLIIMSTISTFAADTYTIDPSRTYVLWHLNRAGHLYQSSKWRADGQFKLDEQHPQNSRVNVIIHIGTIKTGVPALDASLKGKNFFDSARYPTAKFVSNRVDMTGLTSANIYGALTLRNVTKEVMLSIKLNKIGINSAANRKTVNFSGNATIRRSDFGMNTYLSGVGNEAKVIIEAEGYTTKG